MDAFNRARFILRKPLIFGLFRVVPGFFGINGRDGDGGDEGLVAVEIGVAFGQDVDGGEVIFAELVEKGSKRGQPIGWILLKNLGGYFLVLGEAGGVANRLSRRSERSSSCH
jgi:hypothetical protein